MKTHLTLHDRAATYAIEEDLQPDATAIADTLLEVDAIHLSDPTLADIYKWVHVGHDINELGQSELKSKYFGYFDFYGKSSWRVQDRPWPVWQLGPGDIRPNIKIQSKSGPYPYLMNDDHLMWTLESLHAMLRNPEFPDRVFLDDCHVAPWWSMTPEEKDVVWGPADGDLGWRTPNWNARRQKILEMATLAFTGKGVGGVVCNGPARSKGARMFETFGRWDTPEKVISQSRPGDYLHVLGLTPEGGWAEIDHEDVEAGGNDAMPLGTSYRDVVRVAIDIAESKKLSLGFGYKDHPQHSNHTVLFSPERIIEAALSEKESWR